LHDEQRSRKSFAETIGFEVDLYRAAGWCDVVSLSRNDQGLIVVHGQLTVSSRYNCCDTVAGHPEQNRT